MGYTVLLYSFPALLVSLALTFIGHYRKKEGLKNLGLLLSFTIGSFYMWGAIRACGGI